MGERVDDFSLGLWEIRGPFTSTPRHTLILKPSLFFERDPLFLPAARAALCIHFYFFSFPLVLWLEVQDSVLAQLRGQFRTGWGCLLAASLLLALSLLSSLAFPCSRFPMQLAEAKKKKYI